MDINIILTWFVLFSCVLFISYQTRLIRKREITDKFTGWFFVYSAIFVITVISIIFVPGKAGYIGGALWFIFVLIPMLGELFVQRFSLKEEYEKALVISKITSFLHPADSIKDGRELTRALLLIREGEIEAAEGLINKYQDFKKPIHRLAHTLLMSRTGKYGELIQWVNGKIGEENLHQYPDLLPRYIEALGETGQIKKMLDLYSKHREKMSKQYFRVLLSILRLYIFAFTGQKQLLEELLSGKLSALSIDLKNFWLATAAQTIGQQEEAGQQFTTLLQSNSYTVRVRAQIRLDSPLRVLSRDLQPGLTEFIQHETRLLREEKKYKDPLGGSAHKKKAYASYLLMVIILGFFLLEIYYGGSQDPFSIYRLGAIFKFQNQQVEWWRLFTSMFMHFGFAHLFLNLFGLFMVGPFVERSVGSFRFLVIYLLSGLGSMFLATLLSPMPFLILLGASGCIMGLLGAMAYILFRGYIKDKSKIAGKSFNIIIFIFAFQVIFDMLTPNVSMVAHLSGFVFGIILTVLLLAFKKEKSGP
jgi:rhomboid protease GluP